MTNPPEYSQSGNPYLSHFEKLAEVRRALLTVLAKHQKDEEPVPAFTLFCSKRTHSEDEMMRRQKPHHAYRFSNN